MSSFYGPVDVETVHCRESKQTFLDLNAPRLYAFLREKAPLVCPYICIISNKLEIGAYLPSNAGNISEKERSQKFDNVVRMAVVARSRPNFCPT